MKRNITYEDALVKITSLCAKGEYCIYDINKKLDNWDINDCDKERIINFLLKEKYVDETRYTELFIKNKLEYNNWGVFKIKQALKLKNIPSNIFEPILSEVNEDDYKKVLIPLLKNKEKNTQAQNDYEKRGKIIRFALQRGFTMKQIMDCLKLLNIEET